MISRLTSEPRIPSWPIEMPSLIAIVTNSIGKPPASRTPSLAPLGQAVERHVARGDLVPARGHADLGLVPVVVGHADGSEHGPGAGPLHAVGDVAAPRLQIAHGPKRTQRGLHGLR